MDEKKRSLSTEKPCINAVALSQSSENDVDLEEDGATLKMNENDTNGKSNDGKVCIYWM